MHPHVPTRCLLYYTTNSRFVKSLFEKTRKIVKIVLFDRVQLCILTTSACFCMSDYHGFAACAAAGTDWVCSGVSSGVSRGSLLPAGSASAMTMLLIAERNWAT